MEALVLADEDTVSTVTDNTQKREAITDKIDTALAAIDVARENADQKNSDAEIAIEAYKTALGDDFDEENDLKYNAVVNAIADLQKEDLSKNELITATLDSAVSDLKDATTDATIVEEALAAFKEAYTGTADIDDVVGYAALMEIVYGSDWKTDDPLVQESGLNASSFNNEIKDLNAETAEWTTYNAVIATTTATEMRSQLFKFEEADYTNLSSAQKLEFAGQFITALADADPAKADYSEVKSLLTSEVGTYTGLIDDLNVAGDIAAMITALEAISDEYTALGGEAKSDIAEAVLGGAPYSTYVRSFTI